MQFSSFAEFFAMGGYGFYVWLAFGVSFLALFGLLWASRWQEKHLFQVADKELKRVARVKAARKNKQAKTSDLATD
ncbi:heme exporter protein CcmD [Planctobacterium marinum]|uniref:Heme exporter protein D n=1 Tax=Planctobacterium marinum TaxID=1631968 RepID=A0AA48HS45_9ALTE|nr:heme exporter protein D [Planctobacterium marinum]